MGQWAHLHQTCHLFFVICPVTHASMTQMFSDLKKLRCETVCIIFQTLSKRKAWVAALRNFILRYALSLEEPTVLVMNLWKICYNNTTRKPPSSADGASLRQQKLFQRFQMVFTHSRNTRENPFCTQLIHDSRLRLPSPVLGLRTYMWKGRNTAKNSRKPKSFPSAGVRWRGQRRRSPRFSGL